MYKQNFLFFRIGCVGSTFLPHSQICFNNGVAAFNISWSNMCPHPLPLGDFGNEEN